MEEKTMRFPSAYNKTREWIMRIAENPETEVEKLPAERQISEVELGFLNDGRHSDTPGDTVYFRLNHREFFRIRLFSDQRKTPELATFKASWSPQEEERVLLENGHWERPPLPELPE